jgi:hyperosmotically inducible protein
MFTRRRALDVVVRQGFVAAALAALSSAAACAPPHLAPSSSSAAGSEAQLPPSPPRVTVTPPVEPRNDEVITDGALSARIESTLAADPSLFGHERDSVRVFVAAGQVTLRGNVRSLVAKRRALRIVRGFRGVTSLVDEIAVHPATRADALLTRDINAALQLDPATRAAARTVTATVTNGFATLRGTVPSSRARQLLEERAARVPGVRDVTLELLSAQASRPPMDVATEANGRLRDDGRMTGAHVDVTADGRTVRLSGAVGSLEQKVEAVSDARVAGVDQVDASAVKVSADESDRALGSLPAARADDVHIGSVVRRNVDDDASVGLPAPSVHVQHGVVTLSGQVLDFRAQKHAVDDAAEVRGVRRVDDQITVAPARTENDAMVEDEVQRSVFNDIRTPDAPHLEIMTDRGRVTLRGAVASPEEKSLLESDIEEVPGVVAVTDELTVAGRSAQSGQARRPALQIRVIEQIFWDVRVGRGKIHVKATPEGVVTLTGKVNAADEALAAVDDATREGAVRVVDEISVAGEP